MARPTKLTDKIKKAIHLCAIKGFSDKEIADVVDITEKTLNNWKKKHPKFFQSLIEDKEIADRNVEKALYERACGFKCPETKAQWISDDNGGRWEYADMEKIYPPDTPAITLWLKNRQPQKWRDKIDLEHSGNIIIKAPDLPQDE